MDPETWRVQENNKKIIFSVTGKSSQGTIGLRIAHVSWVFGKIRAFKESEAWSEDSEVVLQIQSHGVRTGKSMEEFKWK